jgi:bifunctional UDP-N-acetylglucosamine pyrophosphorylase / glucosamine-1-phosphate N-acetyltransferase
MTLSVVILAAGAGTRMRSQMPKVLHEIAGKSMLERVVDSVHVLNPSQINIIYGHQGALVRDRLKHLSVNWVEQKEQLGTGHAVQQAMSHIPSTDHVLILCGDTPLISSDTLNELMAVTASDGVGIITAHLDEPGQLGRIIRDHSGNFKSIVEYKDATIEQRQINEVNSGLYFLPAKYLQAWLPALSSDNVQQEYYLTDILAMAVQKSVHVTTIVPFHNEEVMGVNDRTQQALLERYYQKKQADHLMRSGVTLRDPSRLDVRGEVTIEQDVVIDINVILEGAVTIKRGAKIGPNCVIRHSTIGEYSDILANSVVEEAVVESRCTVGPYARLRPGSHLQDDVKVGNFVEIKKSTLKQGCKVNHLSYMGDALVGENANIGAGTITCNYDGVHKHKTTIGEGAFIGSGTQLVAPVTIGKGSFVGAGSTISKDTPENQLSLSRVKQITIKQWQSPRAKQAREKS